MINLALANTDAESIGRASAGSTRVLSTFRVCRGVGLGILLTLIGASAVGCYRPAIANGGLGCAPGGQCPAGYACLAEHCWTYGTGPDAGPGPIDTAMPLDQNPPGPDAQSMDTGPCVAPTKPACSAPSGFNGVCDPVCQSGVSCDWCSQKCSIAGDGKATCAGFGPAPTGGPCTIFNSGTPSQHDDCGTGDMCLTPDVGAGYSYCFSLCRTSAECPGGVACGPRPVAPPPPTGGLSPQANVCDPPYSKCDANLPDACCDPIARTGCPPGRFCYLVSPDGGTGDSRTVCEYNTGDNMRLACGSSRDCIQGYGCSPQSFCQRVCDDANPCTIGTCSHAGSGVQYGYCPL